MHPNRPSLKAHLSRFQRHLLQLEKMRVTLCRTAMGLLLARLHVSMGSEGHPSQDHPQVSLTFRNFKPDPLPGDRGRPTHLSTQQPPNLLSFY